MGLFRASTAVTAAVLLALSAPAVAARADGAPADNVIVHVPPSGPTTAFGVTDGPRGLWFSHGGSIDRIRHGVITEYPLPDAATSNAGWLTWDGGRFVWFADRAHGRLGTIDADGNVREWQVPSVDGHQSQANAIVVGPGPYVWFTDQGLNDIGRLDTRTGAVSAYPLPTPGAAPLGLVRSPDGALWFTERSVDKVGRLALDGSLHEWDLPPGAFPNRIVVAPDRVVWFTELRTNQVGHIGRDGIVEQTSVPGGPVGLVLGRDGHLYTALFGTGQLARLDRNGSIDATWDLPGGVGVLLLAQRGHSFWVTDSASNVVFQVRMSRHDR